MPCEPVKTTVAMVNWCPMIKIGSAVYPARRLLLAGAASLALLGALDVMGPLAFAETPSSDGKGYIDSTARCVSPDVAVVFGSTASSRIAICRDSAGAYEYRGVRVRDGAKLIAPASLTSKGFVAESDGGTYTVSASALEVTYGGTVLRDEPMVDFHGTVPAASASASTAPGTSSAATATATVTATATATPAPATPVKPLPAEVGGSAANTG